MSRATSGQNQPFTLIPFFDWFNHSSNGYAQTTLRVFALAFGGVHSSCMCVFSDECIQEFDPQKGFTVHTAKAYEPGEQLFINYGSHGNLRLLRNYGFTMPANPYDTVDLPMPEPLQQPNPADPAFSQKRELLLSATGSQADVPVLKSLRLQHGGSLAPNAEHWLEIMLATPEELNELFRQTAQATPGADSTTSLRFPSSLKHKVRAEVGKLVTSRLKQHSSTFEVSECRVADGFNPMLTFVCADMCNTGRRRVPSCQRTANGAVAPIVPTHSNGRKTNADTRSVEIRLDNVFLGALIE